MSREIKIPVPWGYIAAQVWGSEPKLKVLLIHGLFDNSESFSGLIPLLPKSYCYIAIDLPGHGKSSHFSQYVMTDYFDYIVTLRIVIRYLKENPITLIGHSFGGLAAAFYAQLYAEEVSRVVLIEPTYIHNHPVQSFKKNYTVYVDNVSNFLIKAPRKKLPTYTYEEGLKNFISKRFHGGMTVEAAEKVFKRNTVKTSKNEYQSRIDPLLKYSQHRFFNASPLCDVLERLPVKCPVLYIIGLESKLPKIHVKKLNKVLKANVKYVNGGHHVQSDVPDTVAPLISDFLYLKCNL